MQHLPYAELRRAVDAKTWESYKKVAVVRNPWDRLVSDWNWRRRGGLPLGDLPFPAFARLAAALVGDPEAAWGAAGASALVGGHAAGGAVDRRRFAREYLGHFREQAAYVGPGVRVLRFEALTKEWNRWCAEALGREVRLRASAF